MTKSFRLGSRVPVVAVLVVVLLVSAAAAGLASGAREQGARAKAEVNKVTMALGDIETVETLNLLIAIEHLREKGLEIELVSFKSEDIGSQAVVNGQAQIGIGTPYALIQNVKAPVRVFLQLASLLFFPVVNTEFYQDWKDLDGQEIVVHSRASGTEAIVNLMAQREGIEYGTISYVPGSEVRALALLQGNIKATILDAFNKEFVMKEAPGRFAVLPLPELQASDEALYANTAFLEENPQVVRSIVEEILNVWGEINRNPAYVVEQREKYNLLPDLPAELEEEILPYYELGAANGLFPNDGGGEDAARADLEFYTVAGEIKGPVGDLKVEDFWYLAPQQEVARKLGVAQ